MLEKEGIQKEDRERWCIAISKMTDGIYNTFAYVDFVFLHYNLYINAVDARNPEILHHHAPSRMYATLFNSWDM